MQFMQLTFPTVPLFMPKLKLNHAVYLTMCRFVQTMQFVQSMQLSIHAFYAIQATFMLSMQFMHYP